MTYQFTNDETNTAFTYADEATFERAMDWYNGSTKAEIIAYCETKGLNISKNSTTLVEDWADRAMQLWASQQ